MLLCVHNVVYITFISDHQLISIANLIYPAQSASDTYISPFIEYVQSDGNIMELHTVHKYFQMVDILVKDTYSSHILATVICQLTSTLSKYTFLTAVLALIGLVVRHMFGIESFITTGKISFCGFCGIIAGSFIAVVINNNNINKYIILSYW